MSIQVSILLPNYNKGKYIRERLESINNQSFTNWELIVIDGYSDDGSWEIIKAFSERIDNPKQILQLPRKGIYDAINECIKRASGKYIYIATSDDTMSYDCLEKMVDTLQHHPECDICQCCLTIIDTNGNKSKHDWDNYPAQQFYKYYIGKKHIRLAPLDGILHFGLGTVYTSLTQLLIRSEVFKKIGLFKSDWGASSDFEWGIRASLVCNTIHIPLYLATWRKHPLQATPQIHDPIRLRLELIDMCKHAFKNLGKTNPILYKKINEYNLFDIYNDDILRIKINTETNNIFKLILVIRLIFKRPFIFYDKLINKAIKLFGLPKNHFNNNIKRMRNIIRSLDMYKNIIIIGKEE